MKNNTLEEKLKKNIAQALIGQIKRKNDQSKIKTNLLEGFKQPEKITVEAKEKQEYIPDVVSESDERLDLYEIEPYERNYVLEKWRRFSEYSASANGSFSIVVPKPNLEGLKDMLDLNEINANIIYYHT